VNVIFVNIERYVSERFIKMATKPLKLQLVETFATLMTAAFGMVAALAWNEAIKTFVQEFFGSENALVPMLIYAIVVTIIAVICILLIARTLGRLRESMEAEEEKKKKEVEEEKKKKETKEDNEKKEA
jgi:H+/gluconate symporter-like permease